MKEKKRLDVILCERGLAKSRSEAKSLIMGGTVYVNGQREDKAGIQYEIKNDIDIDVRGPKLKYVSRGGLKLEKAMREFELNFTGLVCLDIGASTGGFTDLLLQNRAKKVYAVDVGYGQLDYKLRIDPRVCVMEKTNARYLDPQILNGEKVDFACVDVSFISLKLILPVLKRLLKDEAFMVCLIKPEFEAERNEIGKRGVVRDPEIHKKVCIMIARVAMDLGFDILGFTYSPIRGLMGNIEYLIYMSSPQQSSFKIDASDKYIRNKVDEAFKALVRDNEKFLCTYKRKP